MPQKPRILAFLLLAVIRGLGSAQAARHLHQAVSEAQLLVNTTVFDDGDWVEVSWDGVQNPTNADAVALYFAGADPDASAPLKFKWAATSHAHLLTGSGSHRFRLTNQRHDLAFLFFYNVSQSSGYSSLNLLGRSVNLTLHSPNDPQHVHLALSQAEGTVIAQWTTRDWGHPIVQWGTKPGGPLERQTNGSFTTYTKLQMCGAPANGSGWVDPGFLNFAAMTGLLPSTRYFYSVGDPVLGMSRVYSFVSGPKVGIQSAIRFLAAADLGHMQSDGSTEFDHEEAHDLLNFTPRDTLQYAFELFYDFMVDNEAQQGASANTLAGLLGSAANASLFLLNGGASFARGQLSQWDVFMAQLQPLASQVPWMLTEGNEERDWPFSGDRYSNSAQDSGGECGVPFWQRFFMPTGPIKWVDAQSQWRSPEWFSYQHGPVHFLHISTEVDFSPGSPQYEFIIQDLALVDRRRTPWVVVNMHRPIYTSSASGLDPSSVIRVAEDLRGALEPVFFMYQVDVTLSGHDNKYERTCPVFKKMCLPYDGNGTAGGPIHVVIGNGGYKLSWAANPRTPPYWATVALEHGFLRCDVTGTTFRCEAVSSMSGNILDTWMLKKPLGWQPDYVVRNLFEQYFISNYTETDFLERTGIPSEGYAIVYEPIFKALEKDNRLLQLYLLNNNSAALGNAVNGVDTVADAWAAIAPVYNMTVVLAAQPDSSYYTKFYAENAVLPIFSMVRDAAAAYGMNSGVIARRTPEQQLREGSQQTVPV